MKNITIECRFAPDMDYVDRRLYDPPMEVPSQLPVAPSTTVLFQVEDVWHVAVWLSSDQYPNVADFIESARRNAVRYDVPAKVPVERLSLRSRLLFVHDRALIDHWREDAPLDRCPTGTHYSDEHCAGMWWDDLPDQTHHDRRSVVRRFGEISYRGK